MNKIITVLETTCIHVPAVLFMADIEKSWAILTGGALIIGMLGGLIASNRTVTTISLFGSNFIDSFADIASVPVKDVEPNEGAERGKLAEKEDEGERVEI